MIDSLMKPKNKPPQQRQNGRHLRRRRPVLLLQKKSSQNRALSSPMIPWGSGRLPAPRPCATPNRAGARRGTLSKNSKRWRSYGSRHPPRRITWTRQRSQVTRRPLLRKSLAILWIRPRGGSLILRSKRNHVLRPLSLLQGLQSQTGAQPA